MELFRRSFFFKDTLGLPLSVQIVQCRKKHHCQISFHNFVIDAVRSGWTWTHAISQVREAVGEEYPPVEVKEHEEYFEGFCKLLVINGALSLPEGYPYEKLLLQEQS